MKRTTLRYEVRDAIGRIVLDRPAKRNAISPTMAAELGELLASIESDPAVRVVSIQGEGGAFCSGGDLAPEDDGRKRPEGSAASVTLDVMNGVYGRAIRALHRFPKPVVAIVSGVAAGAGANLAFACDLVYATPDARFSEIFVKRGLGLDCGGSWLLPRLIGLQRAKELAFFGDWIDAETARSIGLVTAIWEHDAIAEAVEERLRTLAARPPIALQQIKQSLHRALALTMEEALELEAVVQAACTATDDFAEGMRAFIEKREPTFRGR
ncbi:MAG TPA: enoyl-CoA hydratase-related protein [Myxococcota bacterium]|nr:enoyl-CoA hydratase-related protein [Myxococcota bacterium]